MEVKALTRFSDLKEGVIRQEGEVFSCSEERYQEIRQKGAYVERISEPEDGKEAGTATKRRSKKEKGAG